MDRNQWRFLQFVGNFFLGILAIVIAQTFWVMIPIVGFTLWSYVTALSELEDDALWLLASIAINILLVAWVVNITASPWVFAITLLVILWNYLDGVVRRDW